MLHTTLCMTLCATLIDAAAPAATNLLSSTGFKMVNIGEMMARIEGNIAEEDNEEGASDAGKSASGTTSAGDQVSRVPPAQKAEGSKGSTREINSSSRGAAIAQIAEGVLALKSDTFQGELLTSEEIWFVHFHAPWCQASVAVEEQWKTAATQLHGSARLATFDCADGEDHLSICRRWAVEAYPTMLMFGQDKSIDPTGFPSSTARTVDTFTEFVKRRIEEEKAGFPPNVVQGHVIRTCQIEDHRCWAELQTISIEGAIE